MGGLGRKVRREREREERRAKFAELREAKRHNAKLRAQHLEVLAQAGTDWATMELPGKMVPMPHAPGKRRFGGSSRASGATGRRRRGAAKLGPTQW